MKPITVPDLSSRPLGFKVERLMESQADVLYQAWTEKFGEWFAAPGTLIMKAEVNSVFFFETVFKTELDLVEQRHPHYGRFLQMIPDRLVEFTWLTGAAGTKGAETVITIELQPKPEGTLLSLSHMGFSDEESKSRHDSAWEGILEYLDQWVVDNL